MADDLPTSTGTTRHRSRSRPRTRAMNCAWSCPPTWVIGILLVRVGLPTHTLGSRLSRVGDPYRRCISGRPGLGSTSKGWGDDSLNELAAVTVTCDRYCSQNAWRVSP